MATKIIEETQTTFVAALKSAREELQAFLQRGINLAEKRSKAVFRFARTLSKRVGGSARKTKRKR
jgi:endonuclease III